MGGAGGYLLCVLSRGGGGDRRKKKARWHTLEGKVTMEGIRGSGKDGTRF